MTGMGEASAPRGEREGGETRQRVRGRGFADEVYGKRAAHDQQGEASGNGAEGRRGKRADGEGDVCGNGAVHDLFGGRGNGAAQEREEVCGTGPYTTLPGVGCGNGAVHDFVGGRMRQRGRARRGGGGVEAKLVLSLSLSLPLVKRGGNVTVNTNARRRRK